MEDPGFLEDPATGSANGDLACWLLRHGFFGGARSLSYTVSQGSEMGRPSRLHVEASYDAAGGLYFRGGRRGMEVTAVRRRTPLMPVGL